MDSSSPGPASFLTQANALLRKNLIVQKRTRKANIRLVLLPLYFFVIIAVLQRVIDNAINKPCGCSCVETNGDGSCQNICGIQYSSLDQADNCGIPSPPEWPALLQVPRPEHRAANIDFSLFTGLPNETCRERESCPATVLLTGANQSIADRLGLNLFTSFSPSNLSDYLSILSKMVTGTDTVTRLTEFLEPAFFYGRSIYALQPQCGANSTLMIQTDIDTVTFQQELECVQGLSLWVSFSLVTDKGM